MVPKKVEGGEQPRHAAVRSSTRHDERPDAAHHGGPGPGGAPPPESRETAFPKYGEAEYTEAHERILHALTVAQEQHHGEPVYLEEVALRAGTRHDRTRRLLSDLVNHHGLVTEHPGTDDPDLGPRYELMPPG